MEEKKGFVVKDRRAGVEAEQADNERTVGQEGEEKTVEAAATGISEESASEEEVRQSAGEVDFSSFVFSLSTTAMFHLGLFPDPETKQTSQNLPAAKQMIDVIGMLQKKTKGNLSAEEALLVEETLYNLRMYYIQLTK